MVTSMPEVMARLRTPEGQKCFRYSVTSVVALGTSVVLLFVFDGILGLGAVWSSTLATGISAIPSYELNRKWAWGKSGRGHLMREVLPFWVLAFIGWAFSTYSVKLTERALTHSTLSHLDKAGLVVAVYVGAYGILWVGKFIIMNKLLFIHHDERTDVLAMDPVA